MKLQIALDDITREAAKVLLEKIQEDVDIIEIGTPFAYYNDISVIQEFKNLYPKAKILADYKILDGGEFMSALAFRAGADIVTVSVSANNETIAGAIKTARAYEREVLVDILICISYTGHSLITIHLVVTLISAIQTHVHFSKRNILWSGGRWKNLSKWDLLNPLACRI